MLLKNKILLAVGSLFVVSAGLQLEQTSSRLKDQALTALEHTEKTSTNYSQKSIQEWLHINKSNVKNIGQFVSKADMQRMHIDKALELSTGTTGYTALYVGYEDGEFIQADDMALPEGYDHRTRGWYEDTDGQGIGSVVVSEPYFDASTKEQVITISTPVNTESAAGVIATDISIAKTLNGLVKTEQKGVEAMIVNDMGRIIAHSDPELALTEFSNRYSDEQGVSIYSELKGEEISEFLLADGRTVSVASVGLDIDGWSFLLIHDMDAALSTYEDLIVQTVLAMMAQIIIALGLLYAMINRSFAPINRLTDSIKELSSGDGDLTKRLDDSTSDEIGILSGNLNIFIEKLQNIIKEVATSTNQVNNSSNAILGSSEDISSKLVLQNQDIVQMAGSVSEVATASSEVASNAEGASIAVQESSASCEEGLKVISRNEESINKLSDELNDTSKVVKELADKSEAINQIVGNIESIAEQTNLLALNAAIEAARAGEQGRGFAVVADEVRSLAQRVHESTQDIHNIMSDIQVNSQDAASKMTACTGLAMSGVEDAKLASVELNKITSMMGEINLMTSSIASAATEQSAITEELAVFGDKIKSFSDELQAGTAESISTAKGLDQASHVLRSSVDQFKY
ncbi:methyl-accepting chemotaxis protein [Vibrio crassostreae]|uniref:methyl-accepting chemotaxis protein n=1 Tax=Vibrio crassostreae TaxID=246167 RepID=UPI001B30A068|nr:methyl-accepting chemotaxis protein [Vibrio crassostreae]